MKVAIVHELLTLRGGAEHVCRIFADMFPEAPIYTLLYDEQKLGDSFPATRVRPSRLQRYARFSTNHHLYLPVFPGAVEDWDFSEFDLVLSSSSAFAHGIITNGQPKHVSYVHSPARYLWDRTQDVLERSSGGLFGSMKRKKLANTFHRLRVWDSEAAERADTLIAASKEVQRRIELYWRRDSTVIHPPIGDAWFEKPLDRQPSDYFLVVSTLAAYKKIDLAIAAANEGKLRLFIAGEGRDLPRLKRLAGPTIEFLGYRDQAELRDLYTKAIATIFPGEEDFGLVPVESMAMGTPVIAYRSGGALETVKEHATGIFFDEPTPASLLQAMTAIREQSFDAQHLRQHATHWSRSSFEAAIRKTIASMDQ